MIDPWPYFSPQNAAYALPVAFPGVVAVDTLIGNDLSDPVPQAIVTADMVVFHGTYSFRELLLDADDVPDGDLAQGVGLTYNSLTTASGVPLSTYANRKVGGHSRGADLAAKWALQFKSPEFCLFAFPRLCGTDIIAALAALPGNVFNLDGDPIAEILTGWPSAPKSALVTVPVVGSSFDPLYRHRFTTYEASLTAFLTTSFEAV